MLAELPLDTVEFLAEADDSDVGAFMDRHAKMALPVADDDEDDLGEDTKRMHALSTDVTAVGQGSDPESLGEVESAGGEAPVSFVPEGGRIISESQLKLVPKVMAVP